MTTTKTETQLKKKPKLLKGKALVNKGATYLGAVNYKGRGYVEYYYVPGEAMGQDEYEQLAVKVTRDTEEVLGQRFDQRLIDSLE